MPCGDLLYPFQATDFQGAWIRWERRSYDRHIEKRPEIADWHDRIRHCLAEPEVVAELLGGMWGHYRRGVLPSKYGSLYMFVVVRWTGALGDVATAFPTDKIKPFERLVRVKK